VNDMPVKIVEKFGKAVSELLDSRELSTRAVMYKTGVDYQTKVSGRNLSSWGYGIPHRSEVYASWPM